MAVRQITVTYALKFVARFWSVLSIGLMLLFVFGEGLRLFELSAKEWVAFLLFPVGLAAGLVISWKKEIPGSILSILSVLLFTVLINVNWFVLGLLSPALVFLLHGILTRRGGEK